MKQKQTTKQPLEIKIGMIVKHKFIPENLTVAPDEKGEAYSGEGFTDNEISLSHAKTELDHGNLEIITPDSKEGLHTQVEWVENPNETAYRSIGIMHIKNERGFLFEEIAEVKFNWDKYPDNPEKVRKESFANAELIVKAVNEYEILKEARNQLCQLVKDMTDEKKALLDSRNELAKALQDMIVALVGIMPTNVQTDNPIHMTAYHALHNAKKVLKDAGLTDK